MSVVTIRRLNEKGLEKYGIDVWGQQPNGEPPYGILYDEEYSEVVRFTDDKPRSIDSDVAFSSGKEMVDLLDSSFGKKVKFEDIISDDGMWAWLSLLFYKYLRNGEPGKWKSAAINRFIPSGHSFKYYRHCITSRYLVWKKYGDDSIVFLHNKANVGGELNEQIMSTSPIITSHQVVKALTELYYDSSQSTGVKKGGSGKGGGSVRRFRTAFWQLYDTYDLRTMDSEDIISILPPEFDKYKPERLGDAE